MSFSSLFLLAVPCFENIQIHVGSVKYFVYIYNTFTGTCSLSQFFKSQLPKEKVMWYGEEGGYGEDTDIAKRNI